MVTSLGSASSLFKHEGHVKLSALVCMCVCVYIYIYIYNKTLRFPVGGVGCYRVLTNFLSRRAHRLDRFVLVAM